MYLDQPGLMGLWDRAKAVFAPKSHTHQAADVSGVIADGAELMTTNPFSPLPNLYISKIDNAFYAADKRFSVSGELIASDGTKRALSSSELARPFSGNYEDQIQIPAGSKLVLRMNFEDMPGKRFPNYPYGRIIVSFYYVCKPKSVSMRMYNNYEPHGVGWKNLAPIDMTKSIRQNAFAFHNEYYGAQEFELTVEGDGANSYGYTAMTQIEMHLERPNPDRNPFVSKYSNEQLYYPLTAPKFIGGLKGNADTATEIKAQAGVNASLEKLPTWSATPTDSTQLVRRDTGNTATYGRVTFLTVWNYVKGKADALYAAKASPTFTGTPKAPTAAAGTNTTQLATCAFVGTAVTDAITAASAPTDYIVECGVKTADGVPWYYRKWESGRMEAWATIKRLNATTTYDSAEWGYYVKADAVSYPSGFFDSTPRVYMTIRGGTFGWGVLSSLGSKDKTPDMYLYRPTASPGYDVYFDLYVFGKWK